MKRTLVSLLILGFMVSNLLGCEAFVRKFTRKPKKGSLPKEEMVLEPQEYKPVQMTKEELCRQYLLFWKSWQDELMDSLSRGANHKKQIDCANEAIQNLEQLKLLLNGDKQKGLEVYINRLKDLKSRIEGDVYGNSINAHRQDAERIKRNILKDFSYKKIKDFLI